MQKKTKYGLITTAVTLCGVLGFAIPAFANGGGDGPSSPPSVIYDTSSSPAPVATTPVPTPTVTVTTPDVDTSCVQALDEEFIFANGHRELTRTENVLECQVPNGYGGWRTVIVPEIGSGR